MTAEHLLSLPGIDRHALAEIEQALASISIKLNRSRNGSRRPTFEHKEFSDKGILATPITEVFEQDTRIRNAMLVARIRTLGQLVRIKESQLLGLVNFGRTSLAIVKSALAGYQLHLDMTDAQIRAVLGKPEADKSPTPETMPATSAKPKQRGPVPNVGPLAISIDAALDFSRARNSLTVANITTVGQLVRHSERDLLLLSGFGRTSLASVNRALARWALRLGMSEGDIEAYVAALPDDCPQTSKASSTGAPPATGNVGTTLECLLSELVPRYRQLVAFYYNCGQQKRTLEQTGKRFKLTRERVRQLLVKACKVIARGFLRSGFATVAAEVRARGGYALPTEKTIPFLCAPVADLRRDARLINTVAELRHPHEAVFFDADYGVWHLGPIPVEDRLSKLRDQLCVLATADEVRLAVAELLDLKGNPPPEVDAITATFLAREMIAVPGTRFFTHRKASKTALAEHVLRLMFPNGAHFSEVAAATARIGVAKRLEPRNAHAALTLNPKVILWGRGVFRHKDTINLNAPLFEGLIKKIEEMFLPGVSTVSAIATFDRYKSLAVQAGIPSPGALYASLEWIHPKRFLYRHFPDIESLKATRRPKVRRVAEFEAILEDSEGPLSVEQIIERMGSHRQLKDHHVVQRLPESRCVLLYDSGCYVHETVLGLAAQSKRDIQAKTRTFLRRGPGYATTKQVRLALTLPALKLPWTLRLLGSVLEQDDQLSRIYNVVALGRFDSWDSLLTRIIRDAIGSRPGITLDELNDYLLNRDFITTPLSAESFPRADGLSISDGYIRAAA